MARNRKRNRNQGKQQPAQPVQQNARIELVTKKFNNFSRRQTSKMAVMSEKCLAYAQVMMGSLKSAAKVYGGGAQIQMGCGVNIAVVVEGKTEFWFINNMKLALNNQDALTNLWLKFFDIMTA